MASAGRPGHVAHDDIVIGVRREGGSVSFFHIGDIEGGALAKFVREHVHAGKVDVIVKAQFRSRRAKYGDTTPSLDTRIESDIHVDKVESAVSLLRRGIIGSWHKISAKHLARYLAEMEFRFDRREGYDLFIETLRYMVTAAPLPFARLTG